VRAVKNSVSDAAELWIAPNKQFCLKPSLECRQYSSHDTQNTVEQNGSDCRLFYWIRMKVVQQLTCLT